MVLRFFFDSLLVGLLAFLHMICEKNPARGTAMTEPQCCSATWMVTVIQRQCPRRARSRPDITPINPGKENLP